MSESVSLWKLFITFAKIGVMTFGGGIAMLPILSREVVRNNNWTTMEELADYYAIGQCTPGIIAVNTATFIGHKKRGIPGGIFATLGMVFPSLVIIMSLAGIIMTFSGNIYVQKAFTGIRACVCVLIINAQIKLWKVSIRGRVTFILFAAALIACLAFKISPVIIVLVTIGVGIVATAAKINPEGAKNG